MTNIISFVRTHTNSLGEFLRQMMFVALGFGLLNWTSEQQALVISAISALLALLTSKETISANRIDNIVDKAMTRANNMEAEDANRKH